MKVANIQHEAQATAERGGQAGEQRAVFHQVAQRGEDGGSLAVALLGWRSARKEDERTWPAAPASSMKAGLIIPTSDVSAPSGVAKSGTIEIRM